MILRLILFLVICALAYSLYKKLQRGNNASAKSNHQETPPTEMKRCAKCGVHLPANESIQYQTLHFCCEDHKKVYLQDHSSGDANKSD